MTVKSSDSVFFFQFSTYFTEGSNGLFQENYNFRRFKVILTFSRGGWEGLTFSGGVGRGDQIAYSYERSLELVIFQGRGYGPRATPPPPSGSAYDPFPISSFIYSVKKNWSDTLKIESRNEISGGRTHTQTFKKRITYNPILF